MDQDDEEHEENGEHDDEDDGAAPDLDETQKRYRSLSRDESAKADDEEFENICANLKRVSVTISRVLTAASPLIGGQESLGADAGELPAAADAAALSSADISASRKRKLRPSTGRGRRA